MKNVSMLSLIFYDIFSSAGEGFDTLKQYCLLRELVIKSSKPINSFSNFCFLIFLYTK